MTKSLIISILFIHSFSSNAQSWIYHPFPTDSAVWINSNTMYNVTSCCPPVVTYFPSTFTRYCMSAEDTLIGSYMYSKVNYCGGGYRGGLRDNGNGKVYFVPVDSVNELLIYDFTAVSGSVVNVYQTPGNSFEFMPQTYNIGAVDSVLINGDYRKRLSVETTYWIEGIGCTNGLFVESWPNVSNYIVNLDCMSQQDTTIFPAYSLGSCSLISEIKENTLNEEIKIYPNPGSGLFRISSKHKIEMIEIIDLLGNTVYSQEIDNEAELDLAFLPSNIYFIKLNGKKGDLIMKKIVKQ